MVFKLLYEIGGNEAQRDVVPAAVPSGAKQDADALLENNSANSDQRP
jgi:hypothetical protein